MSKVSVIILNRNGKGHLPACLKSLQAQTFQNFEVILVDNGSSDGSVNFVRENYPWVQLILLQDNVGFASGNNIGFTHASGEYIVSLNNDTKAEPHWLEELVTVAESDPQVGMVASRICAFGNPDQIDSLGMKMCRDGMSRGAFRLQYFSSLSLASIEEILLPSACAALYKRAMIQEIGFFDDDFFAYCEDIDLGIRGRLAGWEAVLATNGVVYHKYSQSGGAFSPFKLYFVERNHYWVVVKNFPFYLLLLVPFWTCVRYLEQLLIVLFAHGSGQEFQSSPSKLACLQAVIRGMFDAFKALPRMLKKRKQMKTLQTLPNRELRRLLRQYRSSFKELLDVH